MIRNQAKTPEKLDEHRKMYLNILTIVDLINQRQKLILEAYDITHSQFNILRILRGEYPGTVNLSEIQDRMVFGSPDITRLIDRLVTKKLVERSVNKKDKRKIDIGLTSIGLSTIGELSPKMEATVRNFFLEDLSTEEVSRTNVVLNKVRKLLNLG